MAWIHYSFSNLACSTIHSLANIISPQLSGGAGGEKVYVGENNEVHVVWCSRYSTCERDDTKTEQPASVDCESVGAKEETKETRCAAENFSLKGTCSFVSRGNWMASMTIHTEHFVSSNLDQEYTG